jgi:hypothetical protein
MVLDILGQTSICSISLKTIMTKLAAETLTRLGIPLCSNWSLHGLSFFNILPTGTETFLTNVQ